MDKRILKRRIDVAAGREEADLVIKNGKIIDVFNGEVITGDIAVADGYFVGIGNFHGKKTVDAAGCYVSPAFIDGHVHIESSMISPREFAKLELPHGVTTVIADPHEIANVSGVKGIQYMIDSSEELPFDVYFMLSSCVPATNFELSGAKLEIEELLPFFDHPRVLGLAEVMDFPAVLNGEDRMLEKILETKRRGAKIDGHAAGLQASDLNVYMSAGIRTDHECTTAKEATERLQRGMYLMIREGTVAKNLKALIKVVNDRNARRCLFVTDDKHLDDILYEGTIDHNIRLAINEGVDPVTAIQMASINTAQCFGLEEKGAIAPGYQADFLLLDEMDTLKISHVYKGGKLIVEDGKLIDFPEQEQTVKVSELINTVQFNPLNEADFQISIKEKRANIIEIIPNSLITKHLVEEVKVNEQGLFQTSIRKDQLKLAVIERHHLTGHIGVGIVKGLGLQSGAIASTVAHDSHNLVIAGVHDLDMKVAAMKIKEMQGGLVVVNEGKVIAALPLQLAGLMSTSSYQEVLTNLELLNVGLKKVGVTEEFNPFLTLSFLSLPVIPDLKLTAQGLFDVKNFKHITV
ncbi:adenine deaminase [Anaerobacillus sp. MEB173]|uniref:adenine deaminase n=1 Tax=Anaerobacillus sp. MEB173 TaxID=3383345 RepID=UPI003F8E2C4C